MLMGRAPCCSYSHPTMRQVHQVTGMEWVQGWGDHAVQCTFEPLLPLSQDLEGFWLSVRYSVVAIHALSEMPSGKEKYLHSYEIELSFPTMGLSKTSPKACEVEEVPEEENYSLREPGRWYTWDFPVGTKITTLDRQGQR